MKQRELARLHVLNNVLEYQIPIGQAAEVLGVSERHARRLLNAYRKEGAAALAHGNRGRQPHNAVLDSEAAAVVQLASTVYAGTNHTHLTELLREREGIDLSRPTVRRILVKAGLGSPRSRRSQQHRVRRQRMPQEGMLVQVDGSHHRWLGEGGPRFALLLTVDDATGTVPAAMFCREEDTPKLLPTHEQADPTAWNTPRHLQRPPPRLQVYWRYQPLPGRPHPVRSLHGGAGHPADLRQITPSQGQGGACRGYLPRQVGNRAAPAWRRQHHGGQRGPQ